MLNGLFAEADDSELKLPEDSADAFAQLLRCLHRALHTPLWR